MNKRVVPLSLGCHGLYRFMRKAFDKKSSRESFKELAHVLKEY